MALARHLLLPCTVAAEEDGEESGGGERLDVMAQAACRHSPLSAAFDVATKKRELAACCQPGAEVHGLPRARRLVFSVANLGGSMLWLHLAAERHSKLRDKVSS